MVSFALALPRALAKGWAVEMLLSDQVFAWDLWPPRSCEKLRVYDYPVVLGTGVSVRYLEISEQNPLWI